MKYIHLNALFLLFVFYTSCVQSQTNPPQDKIRNHRSGLSESQVKEAATSKVPVSMVRNVKLARNGDILIASYLGVYRYDARPDSIGGKSFTNITSVIQWPTFWDVLEDRKGNLWFASQDSGVYFYPSTALGADGKSLSAGQAGFQHFTTKDGLAANSALHIYEDRAGNIWFGASRYDARLNDGVGQGKSFRNFTTKDGFPSNNIRLLLEDKSGRLWFGAQGEDMFVYDPRLNGEVGQARQDSIGGKTFTVLKNKDGKTFKNVWSVIEDKRGNIWFGDSDGLWRYDASLNDKVGQGSAFTKVSQRGAYAIIEDKKGNIWTTGSIDPRVDAAWALSRYDQKSLYDKTPTVTEIMGGQPGLLGLLEANDGSIWFGYYGGVYRYDARLNDEVGQGKTITDFKSKGAQQ